MWFNIRRNIISLVGVAYDITERKKIEEEREKLIYELQKALSDIKTLGGLIPKGKIKWKLDTLRIFNQLKDLQLKRYAICF